MTNANEPAFAAVAPDNFNFIQSGLTKRELIGAMALQGILAGGFADTVPHSECFTGEAVGFALMYADAFLAASEGGQP